MSKKIFIFIALLIVIGFTIFSIAASEKNGQNEGTTNREQPPEKRSTLQEDSNSPIIVFTGDGCPHCEIVKDFLVENDISSKVGFQFKEVWYNRDNAKIMEEKANICQISQEQLGVPMLFDGSSSTCLIGDPDIIDFFKQKAGIN